MIAKPFPLLVLFLTCLSPHLRGTASTSAPSSPVTSQAEEQPAKVKNIFDPFTGKVIKNKVRLRLHPQFDSQVIQEMNRGDLVLVLDETDDFYAIQPTKGMKAYIFRTYVLDNVIEGTRVNVRLQPDLDSPIIAQLNSGERIEGSIVPSQTKWLEIVIPSSARFYIAKDYIEKLGDAGLLSRLEKREEEVKSLLEMARAMSELELQKPFEQMKLDKVVADYERVLSDYKDFPKAEAKAQAWMKELQEAYTAKKMAYLELRSNESSLVLEEKTKQLAEELNVYKARVSELENEIHKDEAVALIESESSPARSSPPVLFNMAAWIPVEEALFKAWSEKTGNRSPSDFYREDREKSFTIKGILEPYTRSVKNKPGDYMIVNATTRLPLAFVYSTQVNLQDYVGREISAVVASRPNNHYAFPAYFIFSIE